jgi:ferredoxin-NADP reductase
VERDYSLVSAPVDPTLALCIRKVAGGRLTPDLSNAPVGSQFHFNGPHGYFTFRPSTRPAIFVATGTGLAPFVSMARSNVTGFILLHGVNLASDLYFSDEQGVGRTLPRSRKRLSAQIFAPRAV